MVVKVDLLKIGRSATLKLDGNVELTLLEDKYQELILASRASEGSDNYYLFYRALKCEISKQSAQDLIALGAKEEDLDDMKNFRV